jgi:RsiW-degrading membrane proteinase PrsW (M82 family)
MVFVILLRGVLSLLGHGTWTALLASVLFREGRERHFRLKGKVLGAYVLVVVLHGLWDGLPGFISAVLSPGLDVLIGQAAVGGLGLFPVAALA